MMSSAEETGCLFIGFSGAELALLGVDLGCCRNMRTLDEARGALKPDRWRTVVVHLRAFGVKDMAGCCRVLAEKVKAPIIVVLELRDVISVEEGWQSGAAGFYSVEQLASGLYARAIRRAYGSQSHNSVPDLETFEEATFSEGFLLPLGSGPGVGFEPSDARS